MKYPVRLTTTPRPTNTESHLMPRADLTTPTTIDILDYLCATLRYLPPPPSSQHNNSAQSNNTNNFTTNSTSTTTPFSHSTLWEYTLALDKALPAPYARTDHFESFADALRWAVSHMTHPGGLGAYSRGWKGCQGQVELVKVLLEGVIWPPGRRCEGKIKGSEGVRIRGEEGVGEGKGRRGPAG